MMTVADGIEKPAGETQGEPVEKGIGQGQQDQKDREQQRLRVLSSRQDPSENENTVPT